MRVRRRALGTVALLALSLVPAAIRADGPEAAPPTRAQWHAAVTALFDAGRYADCVTVADILTCHRLQAFLGVEGYDSLGPLPTDLRDAQVQLDARQAEAAASLLQSGDIGAIDEGLQALERICAEQAGLSGRYPPEAARLADLPARGARLHRTSDIDAAVLAAIDTGPRFLFILTAPGSDPAGASVEATEGLLGRLSSWREGLSTNAEDTAESKALLADLLGPLAGRVSEAERILLVPDGRLGLVPFGALRTADDTPLAARARCAYAVSLSQWDLAQRRAEAVDPGVTRALALCDPAFATPEEAEAHGRGYVYVPVRGAPPPADDGLLSSAYLPGPDKYAYVPVPGMRGGGGKGGDEPPLQTMAGYLDERKCSFPRLSRTLREAQSIAAVGPAGSRYVQGIRASEAMARRELAAGGILHLAGYTVWDGLRPFLSSVALSPGDDQDGFLCAKELLDAPVKASLVVLSVARPCPDDPDSGAGLNALVWAFTYAGAPRVLVLETRSVDGDGGLFVRALYEGLGRGHAPEEALRRAVGASASGPPGDTMYRAGAALFGAP